MHDTTLPVGEGKSSADRRFDEIVRPYGAFTGRGGLFGDQFDGA